MDKRNGKHFPRTPDPIGGGDSHLPDEVLLLGVDGELSAHDATQVREHLEACWSCRARRDEIEATIGRVVEYSNSMVRPHLPLSAAGRAMFLANLRNMMEKGGQPTFWKRFTGLFRAMAIASERPVWIAAGALACIVLLLFAEFRTTPIVSAGEVIRKSRESEKELLRSVPRPVVYQKLRIEYFGRSVSRKLYRVPDEQREAESMDAAEAAAAVGAKAGGAIDQRGSEGARDSVKAAFEGAGLNWNNPLSAGAFQEWEEANPDRVDQIDRPSDALTSIRSTRPRGPVSEIVVTFRTRDFHPIHERVLLENAREINVIEEEFEVFSLDAVDPSLLALNGNVVPAAPVPVATPKAAAPPPPPAPTPEQLQEAELRARMALHAAGADLGDQIDVKQSERSGVLVQGIANSLERKIEIESELSGVENVREQLVTPQEEPSAAAGTYGTPDERALLVDDRPMLDAALREKFPDADRRRQFVDATLGASQSAMAHVWALRRLAERYTPEQIAKLTPASRQILELLIRDHIESIREDVETESGLLNGVIPAAGGDPQPGAMENPGLDWRAAAENLFSSLEKVQHDTSILLAGSGSSQNVDFIAGELQGTVRKLKTQLPSFYENVSGNFLAKNHGADQ
jgi:hypothetical protein